MLRTVATILAFLGLVLADPALADEAIFSSQPIDPKNPPATVSTFQAPQPIYCLMRADKPWKQLLGPHTDYLITYFFLDGEQKAYRTIALRRPELLERSDFLLDIAPDPSRMTAYRDRDIVYGTKDGLRFGPELFTKYLGELSPGRHQVHVEIKAYGDVYAQGEFTLEGSDFSGYQALHQRIRGAAAGAQAMPRAGQSNPTLEGQMKTLLTRAGWSRIMRVVIVDKDWWMNRASGGNSPIVSRHLNAAVAARKPDGSCYYKTVTFEQPRLITGGWGALEVVRTSEPTALPEANVWK